MLLASLVLSVASAAVVAALPAKLADNPECTAPQQRRSWHDISDADRKAYLAANRCLLTSPQKLNLLPGAKTRWDELVSLHQIHALQIHTTGQFLPYHRYYLKTLEFLLQECGYTGAIPYWDETRDAGNFSTSVIFDPVTGFGGGGKAADPCVPNGPFANLTVNIGPGFGSEARCVNRRITDFFSSQCGTSFVTAALNHTTYESVLDGIYSGPHLLGHMSLAMMDGNSITSSGDPLFFMHHGFVDKMWADWQAEDPQTRYKEIGGLNAQDPDVGFSEFPGGMEQESSMWGTPSSAILAVTPDPASGDDGGKNLTLNHVMSSLGIIPNATVADVMDIKGGYLCYEYV
jgi:tyrosinase